jgi:hypothetical protein
MSLCAGDEGRDVAETLSDCVCFGFPVVSDHKILYDHLRIVAIAYDDGDVLGRLERDVLDELDPPLNLQGMGPADVRPRLKALRRAIVNPATPTAEES